MSQRRDSTQVAIIGAGPAGLASAVCLAGRGISYVILEKGASALTALRQVNPEMILRSPTPVSKLAGQKFSPDVPGYMKMERLLGELTDYQKAYKIQIVANANTTSVKRRAEKFAVHYQKTGGETQIIKADFVVNATGTISTPHLPASFDPGRCTFQWFHSLDVRDAHLAASGRLLVVGTGISAGEILESWLHLRRPDAICFHSTRSGLRTMKSSYLGIDVHYWGWLPERLPVKWFGWISNDLKTPMFSREVVPAIEKGLIREVANVSRYEGDSVILAGSEVYRPDLVVFATGYKYDTSHLEGLLEHDSENRPIVRSCESTTTPGLFLLGFKFGRSYASPFLRGIGRDARYISKTIARRI